MLAPCIYSQMRQKRPPASDPRRPNYERERQSPVLRRICVSGLLIVAALSGQACENTPTDEAAVPRDTTLAGASISFGRAMADTAIVAFVETYDLTLYRVQMSGPGLYGADRADSDKQIEQSIQDIRQRTIASANAGLNSLLPRRNALIAAANSLPVDRLLDQASGLMALETAHEQLLEHARSGAPLIWGVEVIGNSVDINRATHDSRVVLFEVAILNDSTDYFPKLSPSESSAPATRATSSSVETWLGIALSEQPARNGEAEGAAAVEATYYPTYGDLWYDGSEYFNVHFTWDQPGDWRWYLLQLGFEVDLVLKKGYFSAQLWKPFGKAPCSTWTDLPNWYDDCPTAGWSDFNETWSFGFGTFSPGSIRANTQYFGAWYFWGGNAVSESTLLLNAQEVFNLFCPGATFYLTKSPWCMDGSRTTTLADGFIKRGEAFYRPWTMRPPAISSITPDPVPADVPTWLTVRGSDFEPGFRASVSGHSIPDAQVQFVKPDEMRVQVTMVGPGGYSAELELTDRVGRKAAKTFQVALTLPSAPSDLSASATSTSQINLVWKDNSNNEAEFRIERKTGSTGAWNQIATPAAGATNYQSTGLSPNTRYYYRIRACNSTGCSGFSTEADATTHQQASAPASPSGLSASAASPSQINLVWTDNSNNEDGFRIERCTGSGCSSFVEIATVGAGVNGYQNTGLAASTSYSYRVRAYNSGGNSAYSISASATTLASPAATVAIHRSYNSERRDHLYGHDPNEGVAHGYVLEHRDYFWLYTASSGAESVPLYRCIWGSKSQHFLTTAPDCEGQGTREATLGFGTTTHVTGSVPLYRLLEPETGDHLYTISSDERQSVLAVGWADEGVTLYVRTSQ